MAATEARTGPKRDLDAEVAALSRPRAHEFEIHGGSLIGRLYATPALHRVVPDRLAMRLAWIAGWLWWYWPPARHRAIARVSLTVAGTPREDEARALARRELSIGAMRSELDWRMWMSERAPVRGIERLERVRAGGRPVILTGAHVGGGGSHAVAAKGFPYAAAVGSWLDPRADIARRGYGARKARARRRWGEAHGLRYVLPGGSYDVLRRLLERGEICSVLCDTPGKMPTRMAGKAACVASGPAYLAWETDAVLVPIVGLLGTKGPSVEILEPIDPRSVSGPQAIADCLGAIYGDLMVRHPEQVEPLGYTREVFTDDAGGYPIDLWWPDRLRVRLARRVRRLGARCSRNSAPEPGSLPS